MVIVEYPWIIACRTLFMHLRSEGIILVWIEILIVYNSSLFFLSFCPSFFSFLFFFFLSFLKLTVV